MPNIMRLIEQSNGRTIRRRSRSPVETRSTRSRTSSSRLNQSRTEIATDRLRKRALKNQEKPAELYSTQYYLIVWVLTRFYLFTCIFPTGLLAKWNFTIRQLYLTRNSFQLLINGVENGNAVSRLLSIPQHQNHIASPCILFFINMMTFYPNSLVPFTKDLFSSF